MTKQSMAGVVVDRRGRCPRDDERCGCGSPRRFTARDDEYGTPRHCEEGTDDAIHGGRRMDRHVEKLEQKVFNS